MTDQVDFEHPPEEKPRRVLVWVAVVIGILALLWAGWLQVKVSTKADNTQSALTAKDNQAQTLADAVSAACRSGGTAASILGQACPQAAKIQNNPSPPGERGPQGVPGVQGVPGAQGVPGVQGVPGAVGSQGTPGTTGVPGANGLNGSQGVQGPKGDAGATGAPGPSGPKGDPGTNGANGTVTAAPQPPDSWTYTEPGVPTSVTRTCTRTNADPANPRYNCS